MEPNSNALGDRNGTCRQRELERTRTGGGADSLRLSGRPRSRSVTRRQPFGLRWVYIKFIASGHRIAAATIIVALPLLLAGCTGFRTEKGYAQVLQSWVGATRLELYHRWGTPDHEYRQDDGTISARYDRQYSYTVSGGTEKQRVKVGDNYVDIDVPQPDHTETTWCRTFFHFGPDNIVRAYKFAGPDCRAHEKKAD